jgi:ribosomal protein L31E
MELHPENQTINKHPKTKTQITITPNINKKVQKDNKKHV